MNEGYFCVSCGLLHDEIPFTFAADFPDNYANMTPEDKDVRCIISSDQCVIDGSEFWIRGCLEIPIIGQEEPFLWGVWANVFEEDFDTIHDYWETEGRERLIGPFKGRLGNAISIYSHTINVPLTIKIRGVGQRPLFFVDDTDSELGKEQSEGLPLESAKRYSCILMKMVR